MAFTFLRKVLKDDKGFSLTEAMVGGAILVGVGLAGAMLFKNQNKSQARNIHDQSLSDFHQTIGRTLNFVRNCNATLHDLYGASSISGQAISKISLCGGAICDVANTTAQEVLPGATYAQVGNWIDDKQIWQLTDIKFVENYNKTGPARINFSYTMNPRLGMRIENKETIINLRFGAGKFKECFNNQESSINNLQKDICKSMGDLIVKWDDEYQVCEIEDFNLQCPTGQIVEGLKPDGTMKCRSVTAGVTPFMSDPVVSDCTKKKTEIKLDTATKRLRVVCY